jgi:DNA polymerase-3 subunit beta
MKFSVKGNTLVDALSKVIGVTPIRSTLPILGNILFELKGNQLILTGTDLEVYVRVMLEVDGKQDGELALPSKKLDTLLLSLVDRDLSFESSQNFKLQIKTKGGKWTLTGEDPNDFPLPVELESVSTFTLDGNLLSRYLSKTVHAASTDELRRNMNGVYFDINENEMKVVSTDGHRLMKIINTDFKYNGEKISMLIPVKTCQLIIKLLKASGRSISRREITSVDEADEGTKDDYISLKANIDYNNEFIRLSFNGITLTSRLIDDSFPNYESVIPSDNEKILKVNIDLLINSVKRCIIMSDQVTNRTNFVINDKELKIRSSNNEFGTDSEEVLECSFTESEEFEIAFNGRYLLEAIQQFESSEILFYLNTPLKAAVLRPSEQRKNEDLMMLVMPVRNI